ncbi:hypothetical protein MNBD_GAMMA14-1341 [hydrothermal vent metagenome]|uniref:Uncharacterized protein n=2 Tax=hydrothermal vent metagenome TaxID=652676 RepID=A0A3B0ZQ51_9ZZZZ
MDIQIYQIAFSAETPAQVESGYRVLDNLANPRPDWREFWQSWLKVYEKLFNICENTDLPLNQSLTATTSYGDSFQRKVFLSEQIASLLLAKESHSGR